MKTPQKSSSLLIILVITLLAIVIGVFYCFSFKGGYFNKMTKKANTENVKNDLDYLNANPGELITESFLTDLNNDKKLDLLLRPTGISQCGSGGCQLYILVNTGNAFKLLNSVSLTQNIYVGTSTTNGWRDLIIMQSGGGQSTRYMKLQYNGTSYPLTPENGVQVPFYRAWEFAL